MELKKAIIQCESQGCPWEGKSERYEVRNYIISTVCVVCSKSNRISASIVWISTMFV